MRLLVISSWFPFPPNNGSKLRAYHLLAALAKRHSVTLLSFAEPGEEQGVSALEAICQKVLTVPGNPFKPQRPLGPLELFSRVPRSYAQTYSGAMQRLVDMEILSNDVAVAFQLGAALYLRDHISIPRVVDELEVGVLRERYVSAPWGHSRIRHGLTWWKYGRFMRDLVAHFDRATVVSDLERAHLAQAGCDVARVEVVPNGVDRADLARPNHPKPGRLIYPGSITYSANFDAVRYFVGEILPKVRAVRPDVSLQVTGATGNVNLAELAGNGPVTFTGYVDDAKALVAHSSVCVVPLRIGGGTRLKILESMALGTPVVSTSKGAEGLALTPEQDLLIADTPHAFARQTLRLLDDFVLRARLAANARRLVEREYTWDRIGAQLNDVVTAAVAEHGARRGADLVEGEAATRARA